MSFYTGMLVLGQDSKAYAPADLIAREAQRILSYSLCLYKQHIAEKLMK